jgi:uncharacterized lipoprotein YmbA
MWITLTVLLIGLMGCAGTSKPAKFFLLRSLPEPEPGAGLSVKAVKDQKRGLSVLIGPITLPAYLDRDQVVTLSRGNELVMDEFVRWAEPLKDNFYRVLMENLSLLLHTPEVYAFDRRGSKSGDFQIIIDVTRFECVAEGGAHLTVFWTVAGKDRKTLPVKRKSVFRSASALQGMKGKVDAQNRSLTEFSRKIAEVIRSLTR